MNKNYGKKIRALLSLLLAPIKKKANDPSEMPPKLRKKLKTLEYRAYTEGAKGHPTCDEILKLWDGTMDVFEADKSAEYKTKLADTKILLDQIQSQLDDKTEDQQVQSALAQCQEQCDRELLNEERNNGEITEVLQSFYSDRTGLQAKLNALKIGGEATPVVKGTMDTKKAIIGTFIGMTLLEGSMTYSAVEQLGTLSSIAIMIFVLLYSSAIGGLCHMAGYYYGLGKTKGSFLSMGTAFLFVAGIILLRSYAQNEAYDWVLDIINIAFVAACILISRRLHENRNFWRITEAIAKLNRKIDKANASLSLSPKTRDAIQKKYDGKASVKAQKERRTLKDQLAEHNRTQAQLQANYDNEVARIKAFRQEGKYAIKQSFLDGQNSNQ